MTAQHTVGPWTYEFAPEPGHASEFRVLGPRQAELAYVGADEAHGVLGPTVEANARVMASGPELLEAGKDLVYALLTAAPSTMYPRIVQVALRSWQDAVDKVEGREP